MNPIEEKLRILKPILPQKQWDYLRMSYAMEKDFKKRFQIENLMDMLIAQNVPGLQMDQILLPPPDGKAVVRGLPHRPDQLSRIIKTAYSAFAKRNGSSTAGYSGRPEAARPP